MDYLYTLPESSTATLEGCFGSRVVVFAMQAVPPPTTVCPAWQKMQHALQLSLGLLSLL